MTRGGSRGVVLLHGLPAEADAFTDLLVLEQDFVRAGYEPLRFTWPPGFQPLRALRSRTRSFAAELAAALDRYLRTTVCSQFADHEWVVVAHSGGGTVYYYWLTHFSAQFQRDCQTLPWRAFIFASPYRGQMLHLPNGPSIHV